MGNMNVEAFATEMISPQSLGGISGVPATVIEQANEHTYSQGVQNMGTSIPGPSRDFSLNL